MNKKIVIAAAVLIGGVVVAIFFPKQTCTATDGTCGTSSVAPSKASVVSKEVDNDEAILLDVREPNEFAASHAPAAKNVPLGDIEAGTYTKNDKTKKLYLYCQSGRRAGIAKTALEKEGFTNVENLGGLNDWKSIGGTLVQ